MVWYARGANCTCCSKQHWTLNINSSLAPTSINLTTTIVVRRHNITNTTSQRSELLKKWYLEMSYEQDGSHRRHITCTSLRFVMKKRWVESNTTIRQHRSNRIIIETDSVFGNQDNRSLSLSRIFVTIFDDGLEDKQTQAVRRQAGQH